MAIKKNHIYNVLFFAFLVFLFTPYGLGTRAKLTQGVTYVKSYIFPPKIKANNEHENLDNYNIFLKSIANESDLNFATLGGKVIIVNHWATWCPPCRAEMPSFNKLYQDYKEKVAFVFITSDPKQKVEKYFDNNGFNFPTYNLVSRLPDQINTTSLPATFILNKKGSVVVEEYGAADWNSSKVRSLLDQLLDQ